ncbi:MAG: hydroxyisourate hydrolase [Pegethrix bostrychoides GSE-TBD4-15B]|jgi:5-hydroxyisourate hydrolase|uniref:hydroxyisourate hydrolase n=1 Tax=Pegethrix bostrychoides GSE-TBD4-15B TaxID=2839662 RepID=A0A951P8Z6_9CYAN|nr:hydroxyisourate hydrolase [Pegethrix bostrychoides GSE-TBD4-15B]
MMAGGISIHVMDVVKGCPAEGMQVEILALDNLSKQIAAGKLTAQGTLDHPIVQGTGITAGIYEAVFYIGDFYRQRGDAVPEPPFVDIVPFRFGVSDAAQHYHLPMKVSPWGLSLFRGGA